MAEFINTIDVLGEDVVAARIIGRSITEFKDAYLKSIGQEAFAGCDSLTTVDLPNVETIGAPVFGDGKAPASSLIYLNLPRLTEIPGGGLGCLPKLRSLVLPSVTKVAQEAYVGLGNMPLLDFLDFHSPVNAWVNTGGQASLKALVFRTESGVCKFATSWNGVYDWTQTQIGQGNGYIYVPASLVEDYKASSWFSAVADRIVSLEEHTDDGTIMGSVLIYANVTNRLSKVATSNTAATILRGRPYYAVLSPETSDPIASVLITMGGVNITKEVYNTETGEIAIESVVGDIVISARSATTEGLLHNWDLTSSLTDTVGGVNITLSSTAQRNNNGLTIGAANAYATIPSTINYDNSIMEFDIGDMSRTGTTHGRFIMFSADKGFIYRSTGYWQIYNGSWTGTTTISDSAYFAGKTLRIVQTLESDVYYWTVDVDGEIVVPKTKRTDVGNIMIGSSGGQSYYSVTITGIRIYES